MFRMCQNNEILWSIVMFDPIYMMDRFFFLKISSKLFFHYKSMLWNIKVWLCRVRMITPKNQSITSHTSTNPTFPKVAFFAKLGNRAMTAIATIFHMHSACREFCFACWAASLVVSFWPTEMRDSPVPNVFFAFKPAWVFFNVFNPVHSLRIISGLSVGVLAKC